VGRKSFLKFLRSEYFKKKHFRNEKIENLFKILSSHPNNENENYDKKTLSELYFYILNFFAIEHFQKNKVDFNLHATAEIEERGLHELYRNVWSAKRFSQFYSENEELSSYHSYQFIHLANKHKEKCSDSIDEWFYELESELLDNFYAMQMEKIRARCELNKQKI